MHRLGGWHRLQRRVERWWTAERVNDYATRRAARGGLIARDGPAALRAGCEGNLVDAERLVAHARRIERRELDVLGATIPRTGAWPWHTDWRWNHTWAPAHFRSYDPYETPRPCPYDIRMPWELSRLGFIPPLIQAAAVDPRGGWPEGGIAIVEDWARRNPLAYSVAWDPMEASMRAISLVATVEMLTALGDHGAALTGPLQQLATHGEFVWRTLEYTDVRGNHYAANLVALLLLGLSLDGSYPEAGKWWRFAAREIEREVELQILPDGVDFEKSLAYHRLVTELFVLALVAMSDAGLAPSPSMRKRLQAACTYSAMCTRPDGLTPNVGDNDGARALSFDAADSRDHRELIGLGALLFADAVLKGVASRLPSAAPWLMGRRAVAAWADLRAEQPPDFAHFADGGVVVARGSRNYLWFDVGEVGLAGRGGHGHNDLVSFELMLDGVPLIIDAGCPVYSADRETRDLFRSTAYHNAVRVDGQELAPMTGWWRIGNDATPSGVAAVWDGERVTAEATHGGYRRLPDPVWHTRRITFAPGAGALECIDSLRCREGHLVERYLHLGPEVVVTRQRDGARLTAKGTGWTLSWDDGARFSVEEGAVSSGYGVKQSASVLVLTNTIERDAALRFTITRASD